MKGLHTPNWVPFSFDYKMNQKSSSSSSKPVSRAATAQAKANVAAQKDLETLGVALKKEREGRFPTNYKNSSSSRMDTTPKQIQPFFASSSSFAIGGAGAGDFLSSSVSGTNLKPSLIPSLMPSMIPNLKLGAGAGAEAQRDQRELVKGLSETLGAMDQQPL